MLNNDQPPAKQEEIVTQIDVKDSLIIQTYTHALFKDSIENINYFYTTHEAILRKNITKTKVEDLFMKILQKNSNVSLSDFLTFLKEKININEPFQSNNPMTLWQIITKKRLSFLKDFLKVFSEDIELTLTEKDVQSGESYLINAAKTNNHEFVKLLLKSPKINMMNININRRFYENRGDYMVTWAANGGHLGILKLLKKRFPDTLDVNLLGGFQETILIIAAKKGFIQMVDWLLETFHEISYNQKDVNEDTAFCKALENGRFEICEKILNKFKDVLIFYPKKNGLEILEILIMKNLPESLSYLLNCLKNSMMYKSQIKPGTVEKALGMAILKENWEIVKEMVDKLGEIIDLGYVNEDGKGFLSLACENSSMEILTFLLNSCP